MKRLLFLLLLMMSSFSTKVFAQDTLPKFSVEDKGGGRVVVSWSNPYPNLIQIAVQRSYDSLKRFSTIYSSTSPELPVNGFSDKITLVPGLRVYYRIFYVMKGGSYYFTNSKRPGGTAAPGVEAVDSRRDQMNDELMEDVENAVEKHLNDSASQRLINQIFYIKIKEHLHATLNGEDLIAFRDSILNNTKDTLFQLNDTTILLGIYQHPFVQKTSEFVYTDKDGYIVIKLTDAAAKKYDLLFLEEDETPVLEIKAIKEPYLILDKTNFYHGGWYKFELKENGRIKERNKIFLAKDFNP